MKDLRSCKCVNCTGAHGIPSGEAFLVISSALTGRSAVCPNIWFCHMLFWITGLVVSYPLHDVPNQGAQPRVLSGGPSSAATSLRTDVYMYRHLRACAIRSWAYRHGRIRIRAYTPVCDSGIRRIRDCDVPPSCTCRSSAM